MKMQQVQAMCRNRNRQDLVLALAVGGTDLSISRIIGDSQRVIELVVPRAVMAAQ